MHYSCNWFVDIWLWLHAQYRPALNCRINYNCSSSSFCPLSQVPIVGKIIIAARMNLHKKWKLWAQYEGATDMDIAENARKCRWCTFNELLIIDSRGSFITCNKFTFPSSKVSLHASNSSTSFCFLLNIN